MRANAPAAFAASVVEQRALDAGKKDNRCRRSKADGTARQRDDARGEGNFHVQ
jgi:hypothetical protein